MHQAQIDCSQLRSARSKPDLYKLNRNDWQSAKSSISRATRNLAAIGYKYMFHRAAGIWVLMLLLRPT